MLIYLQFKQDALLRMMLPFVHDASSLATATTMVRVGRGRGGGA